MGMLLLALLAWVPLNAQHCLHWHHMGTCTAPSDMYLGRLVLARRSTSSIECLEARALHEECRMQQSRSKHCSS